MQSNTTLANITHNLQHSQVQVIAWLRWWRTLEPEWICHYHSPPCTKIQTHSMYVCNYPFHSLSQYMTRYFCKVWACGVRDVANCDMVGCVLLRDDVNYHSKVRIWNDKDPNHIVIVHDSGDVPFVLVICCRCCMIATHCLQKHGSWVGVWIWGHIEMRPSVGEWPQTEQVLSNTNMTIILKGQCEGHQRSWALMVAMSNMCNVCDVQNQ